MKRAVMVGLAIALVACGGGDDDGGNDAESRILGAVEANYKNQAGRVYDEYLLPSQAAMIDRDHFISCNTATAGMDVELDADEEYTETVNVPTIGEAETTALTYTIQANDSEVANTSHAVEVDGEWYVYYPQDRLDAYAAGECP